MTNISNNKLSVYLIKSNYQDYKDILKDFDDLQSVNINEIGTFYYGQSLQSKPGWIKKFFIGQLEENINLFNASSKAIFLSRVQIDNTTTRIFAIPFGLGRLMMNNGVYDERFGLKITLNSVDSKNLRKIDKKSMSSIPKHSIEQISQEGNTTDFNINYEHDLIQSITGRTKEELFGKTITGRDSFNLSAKVNIENLNEFLKKLYKLFLSEDYKSEFGWVDYIAEITNKVTIQKLNEIILEKIKNQNFEKMWMSIPEIIDWADISGFKYKESQRVNFLDDISLESFIDNISEESLPNLSIESLKKKKVFCFSSSTDTIIHQWSIFQCLYAELQQEDNNTYLLTNGKWYEIDSSFAESVNTEYKELLSRKSIEFPDYNHESENHYNKFVSQVNKDFVCLDGKNINFGGGYSKIEFCDLYSVSKEIVHVKRYSGSSVLSHLFSQGAVSGELFLSEQSFRNSVNELLPLTHQIQNFQDKPNANDYSIIFAIISKFTGELNLPFFSKVNLKNTKKLLETFGYKLTISKINNIR